MRGRQEAPHSNPHDLENLRKLSTYLWDYRRRVHGKFILLFLRHNKLKATFVSYSKSYATDSITTQGVSSCVFF